MSESANDGACSSASSLKADLSKLVIWAHTHGTICNQIPALEFMQNMDHLSSDNAALWMCRVGHAYHWYCGKLHDRGEEQTEAVGRRKRLLSSEYLTKEASFEEKRPRLTPLSSEMGQTDSGSTGSRGRSQGFTEQMPECTYTRNNEPRGSQNTRKPITLYSAAEQRFSVSGGVVRTDKQDMKSEHYEVLEINSDEEQREADEDSQEDRLNQDNVSEPSAEEPQMLHCQNEALHQPTAPQRAAFAPTPGPPLTRAYILQSPVSDPEDPSRNVLRQGAFTAAQSTAETSGAGNVPESAAPKVCFKPIRAPSTEARVQLESQPSVVFFEFQAAADVQEHLQLSPPECGTPGTGSSRDGAENVGEDSEISGSEQTPCSSAFQNPDSNPPGASNRGVLKKQEKKKSYTLVGIKVFKEWLKLHHPSEMRKIHMLPPADLDHYLVLFFSSAKRQNGRDFSARSFSFFQRCINWYLRDHNYKYNMLRGPEFRASQEAWKSKHWYLVQKEKGEEWNIVKNMTDEDVKNLSKKGILSKTHPQGLLHIIFTNLIRGFGASTHLQAHQLCWGQVVLRKTKEGVEYLEWRDDLSPEGNKGEPCPRLFAKPEDPEHCPVASYKEYARKRPPDMMNDDHPLYLSPNSLWSIWDKVWYSRKALARTKLDKIFKLIKQEVGGGRRKTRNQTCPFSFAP